MVSAMEDIMNLSEFNTLPRRRNSLRKIIFNSFRLKKKVSTAPSVIEEETPNVYTVETSKNTFVRHVSFRNDPKSVFGPPCTSKRVECSLVKYFQAEGKSFDPECRLTSFERKRRGRQEFSEINRCNLQLFCPEQASQVEMWFTSACVKEVILRVTAPNGEVSNILQPKNTEPAMFAPSKVGCGHGKWTVEIAVREGVRFRFLGTKELHLDGQGCLTYQVDSNYNLRLTNQLWLSFH